MNKNEIIDKIVREGIYKNICRKICRKICRNENLYEDLFHEVILILLEKDSDVIERMFESGELKPFFIGIIQNNLNSGTSPFYNKYIKFESKCQPIGYGFGTSYEQTDKKKGISKPVDIESNYDYDKIIEHINLDSHSKVEWFDCQVVNQLLKEKNIYRLSLKTGINRVFLKRAIERFKESINGNQNLKRRSI